MLPAILCVGVYDRICLGAKEEQYCPILLYSQNIVMKASFFFVAVFCFVLFCFLLLML